jgi:regulatory protein
MGPVQEVVPGIDAGEPSAVTPAALLEDTRREAMARAGRLLATRPRTEKELSDRLTTAGFEPAVVAATIDRLRALKLVDDDDFAAQWVQERSSRKSLSRRALLHELCGKGVPPEVAEAALAESGLDEEALATELAARYVRRVATKPLAEQFTRIQQMLARRGYGYEVAEAAARAVLPPEGWD